MIIFWKKYMAKKALTVFICVLICTLGGLPDFEITEKQKVPGLEKKSVFMAAEMGSEMAAENTVAKNTDKAVN